MSRQAVALALAPLLLASPGGTVQSFSAFHMKGAWLIHDIRYALGPIFRKLLSQ